MTRALIITLLLSACTQFPEVDAVAKTNLPAPSLLPTDQLIAPADQAAISPLDAEVARLQARADALRNQ
jgi:hypothetical protein